MATKIGIIGNGNVGSALRDGLSRAGYDVRDSGNDPSAVRGLADWASVIILAVPHAALGSVIQEAGNGLNGKVLVDVTNVLNAQMGFAQPTGSSGAEELQKRVPKAKVVKAFNTVFAQNMSTGKVGATPLSALVAGDDAAARAEVSQLASKIGFDSVDAGPLSNARYLEALGYLNIQLGYVQKLGPQIGFHLIRG